MQLGDWINKHPRDKRARIRRRLAKRLGVSEVYVRSMANGNRPVQPEFAVPIETFTDGQVTRYESCPDVFGKPPKSIYEETQTTLQTSS